MAVTQAQMTSKHSTLEIAADEDGPWTDLPNVTNFEPDGGAHMTGSANVFGRSVPLTGIGNKEPVTANITVVYSEVASEDYDLLEAYFESQANIWLRYRPGGTSPGIWQFVGRGYITNQPVPPADAGSGDLLAAQFAWFGNELERQDQTT